MINVHDDDDDDNTFSVFKQPLELLGIRLDV